MDMSILSPKYQDSSINAVAWATLPAQEASSEAGCSGPASGDSDCAEALARAHCDRDYRLVAQPYAQKSTNAIDRQRAREQERAPAGTTTEAYSIAGARY